MQMPIIRPEQTAPQTLFTFAIVSDRTGWHRPGVFESAMARLNWLSPDFVMSVGDLIEGYLPLSKLEKPNANCYTLSTTGGGSPLRGPEFGEFDHLAWVTMTTEGPRVANLLLEGILPDDVRSVSTEEVLAQIQASRPVRFENQVNIAPLISDEAHEEELRVQFHNHRDVPAFVELNVQHNWDFEGHWSRERLEIPAGGFRTAALRIRKKSQSHPLPDADLTFTSTYVYQGDEAMPQLRLPMKWTVFGG